MNKLWYVLKRITIIAGIISLVFTLVNTFILNQKVADLERHAKVVGLVNSFCLKQPHLSKLDSIPAKQSILFSGPFAGSMPEMHEAWAVLEGGGEYYILRPQLQIYKVQRRWEQSITPWPGVWKFHICV